MRGWGQGRGGGGQEWERRQSLLVKRVPETLTLTASAGELCAECLVYFKIKVTLFLLAMRTPVEHDLP